MKPEHGNRRMMEKVENGEAVSVHEFKLIQSVADDPHGFPYTEGTYELPEFIEDVDYCNNQEGRWIWSIGECYATGKIFASYDNRFYLNDDYKCLFLR